MPPPRKNSSDKTRCNRCRYQRQKCSLSEDFVSSAKSVGSKVTKKSQEETSGDAKRQAGSKRKEAPVSPESQVVERNVRTRSQGSARGSQPFVMVPSIPGLNPQVGGPSLRPSSSAASLSQISRPPSISSFLTNPPAARSRMIGEFESALARIAAAEERAAQAVEEARRAREEARRVHAEVTKAYIGALTTMGQGGSSVATSEIADTRGDGESGSESGSEEEEEGGEIAGDVGGAGDGDYEEGSAAAF